MLVIRFEEDLAVRQQLKTNLVPKRDNGCSRDDRAPLQLELESFRSFLDVVRLVELVGGSQGQKAQDELESGLYHLLPQQEEAHNPQKFEPT